MNNKKEMIERVLGEAGGLRWEWAKTAMISVKDAANALTEQAIVIECEVEQGTTDMRKIPWTTFVAKEPYRFGALHCTDGHHGTPGKAIAIIVSLEEREGYKGEVTK